MAGIVMPHMAQIDVRSSTKAEGFRISMRTGTKKKHFVPEKYMMGSHR
jgi:hypothetical protein